MTEEEKRLEEARTGHAPWKLWGPYMAERAWGTVREDYSPGGTAWEYFPHDHARSRANVTPRAPSRARRYVLGVTPGQPGSAWIALAMVAAAVTIPAVSPPDTAP